MFKPVNPQVDFNKLEQEVLEFWRTEKMLNKVLEVRKNGEPYVFFEGPPTANAMPGIHHVETRVFKDIIPRYQTMRGKRVDRKAGWDTHGLPVELQVEKKLGLKNKKEIEAYGIAKFNEECKKDVWTFKEAWEKLTERIGFWLDLDNPYITYENSYIESVWSVLQHANKRGLLYQGHKVVPYCTRCGTALSSHEVAQGYKNVTDTSVYVKFKLKSPSHVIPDPQSGVFGDPEKEGMDSGLRRNDKVSKPVYVLAWTTTPWTLPGNVALAVGKDIEYAVVEVEGEYCILAKDLLDSVLRPTSYILQSMIKGSELVGLQYEPLFPDLIKNNDKAFRIYDADFVTTTDGTGVVHTAVMYGEDDYNLGVQIGLPTEHTVGEDGRFLPHTGELSGKYVKAAETEEIILHHLESHGLLLKSAPYTHEYPFCWRCDTALLYYARTSWFIRMSQLREDLVQKNNSVNWEPMTIKEGRMGEWLENAKDWAISRERYWGTPLPIWVCKDGHTTVVSSLNELTQKANTTNKLMIMRHGEALNNVQKFDSCWPEKQANPLTPKGKEAVQQSSEQLKNWGVDVIISSDIQRAKETAEIVAQYTGAELRLDERLREINMGEFNGEPYEKYDTYYSNKLDKLTKRCPGGENFADIRVRVMDLISEINRTYKDKKILIISHGDTLFTLQAALKGIWDESLFSDRYPKYADPYELVLKTLPFNANGEIDLHRPYIDDIKIKCDTCGKEATRVKEVADVWLDSGAMPFAQWGYPQQPESIKQLESHYPANYISEAIDQTRGWFYTLLAVATLMEKDAPYKNVICLGHVLDEHGKKMSKSKGNTIDPWQIIEKYGVDALRFYFYSVNPAGEPKLFTEKDVQTVQRRVLLLWWNVYSFFVTYANQNAWEKKNKDASYIQSSNVLDRWVMARLNQVIKTVTDSLEAYDLLTASRALAEFIDDLSTWYLRRSRSRFSENAEAQDREAAFSTMYHVLETVTRLMAPLTPFISENMYLNLTDTSVHLSLWPEKMQIDEDVLKSMKITREIVSSGLDARMKAGVKVRQKLDKLVVLDSKDTVKLDQTYFDIIKDEVNVNVVILQKTFSDGLAIGNAGRYEVGLDTTITPELKRDGMQRELARAIQDLRKKAGLSVQDKAQIVWTSEDPEVVGLLSTETLQDLQTMTRTTITRSDDAQGQAFDLNGHPIQIKIH